MGIKKYILVGVIAVALFVTTQTFAATNIDFTFRYAWTDLVGWMDFYSSNNVEVSALDLRGWANSSAGEMVINCVASPPSELSLCSGSGSDYKVNNTTTIGLAGWGWNDTVGWTSFCGDGERSSVLVNTQNGLMWECPPNLDQDTDYRVYVDPNSGDFSGWGWNDIVGWVSFNCKDPANEGDLLGQSICTNSNYRVNTTWRLTSASGELISSVFDSQVVGGSAINTIMWRGDPVIQGTKVFFQIASSNCSNGANPPGCTLGSWNYIGPDGTSNDYYNPGGPDIQSRVNLAHHNNKRYWRYKVRMETDLEQTKSPRIEDIIVNWSP